MCVCVFFFNFFLLSPLLLSPRSLGFQPEFAIYARIFLYEAGTGRTLAGIYGPPRYECPKLRRKVLASEREGHFLSVHRGKVNPSWIAVSRPDTRQALSLLIKWTRRETGLPFPRARAPSLSAPLVLFFNFFFLIHFFIFIFLINLLFFLFFFLDYRLERMWCERPATTSARIYIFWALHGNGCLLFNWSFLW